MKLTICIAFIISTLSVQAQDVKVTIHSMSPGYQGFEDFAGAAAAKLEKVFNSPAFRQAILDGSFTHTGGKTNEQLYNEIKKAHEHNGPGGEDGVVDLRLRTITLEQDGSRWVRNCHIGSLAGTIGVDGSGNGITATCPDWLAKFKSENDIASLAGHYAHEYMHTIGYEHSGFLTVKRNTFVYQVGDIVKKIIQRGNYETFSYTAD